MSSVTTSANDRSPKLPAAQCRTPSLTCIPARCDRCCTSTWAASLPSCLSLGEQVAEHVGVDVVALGAGQYPVFVPVALEDRLDDQIARVAGHRPFEAAQRLGDHVRRRRSRCRASRGPSSAPPASTAGRLRTARPLWRGNRSRTVHGRRPRPGRCRRQWSSRSRWCATVPWPPAPGRAWSRATAPAETRPGVDHRQHHEPRRSWAQPHCNS